ncbi:DUF4258 domain-containing protein [Alcaligenaceae bacterium A4P071]|nr:DUF4258 domain-containing protein [Alcaligenaceae bacterium A4P071]
MNVRLLSHAKLRMRQRRITMTQVYACLCQGVIAEPTHQDVRGDWRFTLTHRHAGDIVIVAGAIKKDDNGEWVAVITVFLEGDIHVSLHRIRTSKHLSFEWV